MDCSRFEEQLSDYIDGQLTAAASSLLAAHALQCRECRQLLDGVKFAISECKRSDEIPAPDEIEPALIRIALEHREIDCPAFEEIMTEFLDGFVPAAVYHRFEAHSATCQKCSTLLTDVVYAVAACHSVHTYEEYEVPEGLSERLEALMPARKHGLDGLAVAFRDAAIAIMSRLMPTPMQGAAWSFTTASMLVFATLALLLFGFSDDRTVEGIYRQAHVRAAEIYSQGADIYAQKQEVVARIHEVRSSLGEIWDTLGGEAQSEADAGGEPADKYPSGQ